LDEYADWTSTAMHLVQYVQVMTELRAQLARSQTNAASIKLKAAADLQQRDARVADLEAECGRLQAQAAAADLAAACASGAEASQVPQLGFE
jgi:hypothetical protein